VALLFFESQRDDFSKRPPLAERVSAAEAARFRFARVDHRVIKVAAAMFDAAFAWGSLIT